MLSFCEALEEDQYLGVVPIDDDIVAGWDVDLFFFEGVRKEIRLFAGTAPDVTFRCRDRTLTAHQAILKECSFFETLLADVGDDEVEINDEIEIFYEVVRWIYCHDASVDKDIVLDIMRLAELYGLEDLVDHCVRAVAAAAREGCSLALKTSASCDSANSESGVSEQVFNVSVPFTAVAPVVPVLLIDSGAPVTPLAAVASPDSRDPLAGVVSRHSGVKAVEHVAKKNVKEKGA